MSSDAKLVEILIILYDSAYKKRFVTRFKVSRTANRHRWVGREY